MSADTFAVGDVVVLKSGGPHMTVEEVGKPARPIAAGVVLKGMRSVTQKSNPNLISCQWFIGTELNKDWFKRDVLKLATAE